MGRAMPLTPSDDQSLGLLTDMYELTMALGYWRLGLHERRASFYLSFRHLPFQGGYAMTAGLSDFLVYLDRLRFSPSDLDFLSALPGNDGKPIFDTGFLQFLADYRFTADIDAMPEGTVAFPHEPLVRVSGPVLDCQIVESALLHLVGFQTLVATKATRICAAARGMPVMEFGLRRAQGSDGGVAASRAAYIGGCAATSNLLAAKQLGIPCSGTLAHSWIMLFDSELEAFQAYASALPNNSVFLVDTYDTLHGVRHAITVGSWLRQHGHRLGGIRLDSGDLAYLSTMAREMLDQAGFKDAVIVASNDLDETIIDSLVQQQAAIDVWGVGTRLATSYDHPALGAVYKISAIQDAEGCWHPRIKISEQAIKVSTPGVLQVRRYVGPEGAVADMIYDELAPPSAAATMVDPLDATRRRRFESQHRWVELLRPVIRDGRSVSDPPSLSDIREYAQSQLHLLHPAVKRLVNPHSYPVGLEEGLHAAKTRLVMAARGFGAQSLPRSESAGGGVV
jgi:nicotinate phosphoribosyltransferase